MNLYHPGEPEVPQVKPAPDPAEQIVSIRLGRLFLKRREELGLSLRQLEAATTINLTQINRIENGQLKKPAFIDILKLASFYKIPLNDLVEQAGLKPNKRPTRKEGSPLSTKERIQILIDIVLQEQDEAMLAPLLVLLQAFSHHLKLSAND